VGFTIVDDMDLCVTHQSNQAEQVVMQMKKAMIHWEGLLQATGGVLVPEKCFWYLVKFEHTNSKWSYKKCNQVPGSISLLDSDHQQVPIQRLEPLEARQTLGIQIAPNDNMATKLAYLLDVTKEWQRKMKHAKLGCTESISVYATYCYRN